jgi:nicotinamide-nucleotide amidase
MKAEIISIGTELLLGEITDTNSSFIASQLPLLGIDLYFISTVGDNHQRLINTLKQAWQRSDIIITTGGLGPTQGDITRESIADLLQEELTIDTILVQKLREFFCHRKLDMPESNIKQAAVIPSSQPIYNSRGTAPGWWVERDGHIIISMPGPTYEMEFMWTNDVLPKLSQKLTSGIIVSRTLKTFGLGEAKVSELISPFFASANPTLGIYAKRDGIHLRITAKSQDKKEAERLISECESELTELLHEYIWGKDSDTLEGIAGEFLINNNLSLSTMESDTGGCLANTITGTPESSAYFKGGLIASSNESKIIFGIDPKLIDQYGPASIEIAEAMATKAREIFDSNIGIGITGTIAPANSDNKTIGTIFISIDDGKIKHRFTRNSPGHYNQIKQRAAISALFELNKILIHGGTHALDYRRL